MKNVQKELLSITTSISALAKKIEKLAVAMLAGTQTNFLGYHFYLISIYWFTYPSDDGAQLTW